MEKESSQWLIPILLAVGAAGALWYYWVSVEKPVSVPAVEAPVSVPVEPQTTPEPLHPVPEPDVGATERPELVPLPALDQSDEYFKLALTDLFGDSLEEMLVSSGIIERIVATVDNLPRAHVAERVRPLGRLDGQFTVDGQDASGEFTISDTNYDRYDALVGLLSSADLQQVADVYRRFYPLFQGAYVDLGYPKGYFNDRLVEAIDNLLATPDINEPVSLVRPHVLYEFSDPDLESLSSGQKMLLRMGSEHRSSVKQKLREFRNIATQM